jgi:hypothetical protein
MGKRDKGEAKALKANETHGTEVGAIAGEIAGAIVGSAAGPMGTVAGMVFGGIAGALAGRNLDSEAQRAHKHDEELDEAIGVIGGNLGSVRPGALKARVGAPSAASAGVVAARGASPAEGPMQDIDEDG